MKILVTGGNKSGTTALAFAVGKLFPGFKIVTEPASLAPSAASDDNLIVKYLRPEIFDTNLADFDSFDIRLLIVRHPFDRLVSGLYYGVYGAQGFSNDVNVNRYLDLIVRRVAGDPVSFSDVYDLYNEIVDNPMRSRRDPILHQTAATLRLYQADLGFHVIRYEDFVDGKTEALDAVLGGRISPKVEVPDRVARVARSKSYGEWPNWFTPQDAARFAPEVEAFATCFGYDLTAPETPAGSVPDTGPAYVERLVNEMRRKNGLPEFVRGSVDLGPEGDQLDRALLALHRGNTETALTFFSEAVRLRPDLGAIYSTFLRAALHRQRDDVALHALDRAVTAGIADEQLVGSAVMLFAKHGAPASLRAVRDLLDANSLPRPGVLDTHLAAATEAG